MHATRGWRASRCVFAGTPRGAGGEFQSGPILALNLAVQSDRTYVFTGRRQAHAHRVAGALNFASSGARRDISMRGCSRVRFAAVALVPLGSLSHSRRYINQIDRTSVVEEEKEESDQVSTGSDRFGERRSQSDLRRDERRRCVAVRIEGGTSFPVRRWGTLPSPSTVEPRPAHLRLTEAR